MEPELFPFENYYKKSHFQGTTVIQIFIALLVFVTEHFFICRFESHE